MSRLDGRYRRVSPTQDEVAAYNTAHGGGNLRPAVYRVECLTCGARIWGSGLGIGSHERGAAHNEAQRKEVQA